MKTYSKVSMMFALSAVLMSVPTFARSIQVGAERVLENVIINGEIAPKHYANVKLNFLNSTISVVVIHDPCATKDPLAYRCLAMASVVQVFEVPIQKTSTPCNSNIYAGIKDMRPVDGPRQEVKVSDHRDRFCKDKQLNEFVVEAKSLSARGNEETHYLMF